MTMEQTSSSSSMPVWTCCNQLGK